MNIYYTGKDIEELVSKGIFELELAPNTHLTDFARETAEQLNVTLIDVDHPKAESVSPKPLPSAPPQAAVIRGSSYDKPRGCQGEPRSVPERAPVSEEVQTGQSSSPPVNRLVDLMGKIINRGD